jgi:hypothetical protein
MGIIGFTWWSVRIQMLQKKAWEAFSKKYNLNYQKNKFFEAPRMEGYFGDYYIRAYEGQDLDAGGRTSVALLIEMELRHAMPFDIIVCPKKEQVIFQQFNLPKVLHFKAEKWQASNLVGTDDDDLTKAWLIPERLEMIQKFFMMPNSRAIYVGTENRNTLILQQADPITDPRMMQKILKRMIEVAEMLEVPDLLPDQTSAEAEKTKSEAIKTEDGVEIIVRDNPSAETV